jgi:transcriptional regulator with XRE-family HTH domain
MTALLGDRIRTARERYGMSQAELARRIKVSKQTMYQIESNKTPDPGALKVKAIADVLRVSTDYLLGRTNEETQASVSVSTSREDVHEEKPTAKRQRTRKRAMTPGTAHP